MELTELDVEPPGLGWPTALTAGAIRFLFGLAIVLLEVVMH
jgi:hypothetical protein